MDFSSKADSPAARKENKSSRPNRLWSEIVRLVKYQLVGISNSVVSLAVMNLFFLFLAPTTRLILVLGSTAAYIAGDINSFVLNGKWTFQVGRHNRWKQALRFTALSVLFMGINAVLLWGAAGWLLALSLPTWLMSNVPQVFMGISGAVGYVACRMWVFR